MERLWAPWRLNYVSGNSEGKKAPTEEKKGCIFCDKPAQGPEQDGENLIVSRGPTCFVILNAFPYNNGHLMVVPYRHISTPTEMTPDEASEMMATAAQMTTILSDVYRPDGYNIGINVGSAAGAGIAAHLHLHVVPRWNGDTNFMPVVGEVKVLPETLPQTWERVTTAIARRNQSAPDSPDTTDSPNVSDNV
ncbi:MAG: HIT domain-containing protein [Armatimonadaceae bacterium]